MKRVSYLLISLLLINYSSLSCNELIAKNNLSTGDSIKIVSTPDLFNLSVKWASEYNRLNPGTKIKVIDVSDSKIAGDLIEKGNIGFISNELNSKSEFGGKWNIVVGRDVIVPVMNAKNPFINEISVHGVSRDAFLRFLSDPASQNWGTLLKGNGNSPAHYYRVKDESIKKALAGFLKTDNIASEGVEMTNSEEMISAIQKDPYAIGFCKMINILDLNNQTIAENIRLLPIDRNGNGKIDYNENIYNDLNAFSRGVWIGKYPKALFTNIYSVSSAQPSGKVEIAFLKWIVTDGQQFLSATGYSDLLATERQSAVDRIYEASLNVNTSASNKSILSPLLFVVTGLILAGLLLDAIARQKRRKKAEVKSDSFIARPVLDENSLIVPGGIYYDKTHTWSFLEQNGTVKVGIDDFLQHITGKVTGVKLKDKGDKIKKGEPFLSIIQNGKQLALYAPISGIITKINEKLNASASLINTSPYNDGWIYMIEPANWSRENQLLFMAEKHMRHIKNEFSRLKEFLATALKDDTEKYSLVILQDGGELRDGILSDLGPEVWEDFQTKFIDPSRQVWFYEIF